MPARPTLTRRRVAPRRVLVRPRPVRRTPARTVTPPPPAPPPPPPEKELPPGILLVAWALLLGGFAGFATAIGGAIVLSAQPEVFAPQRDLRFGLVIGAAAVLTIDAFAVASGLQLLARREWGRVTALALCTIGLFGSMIAAGIAYFGGLLDTWAPVAPSVVVLALLATVTAAIFFGWAIPLLSHSSTAELFRPVEGRPRASPPVLT